MAKMLRIVSKKEGFRRCGVAHSTEPKDYPLDSFTKKQIEELKKEPNLYVHEVEVKDQAENYPAAGDGKAGGKSGGKNT